MRAIEGTHPLLLFRIDSPQELLFTVSITLQLSFVKSNRSVISLAFKATVFKTIAATSPQIRMPVLANEL